MAASGRSRTSPTSPPVFDITPANTIASVRNRRGADSTSSLSAAEMRPLPSATAVPSIATSTVPRGAKPVKLRATYRGWLAVRGPARLITASVAVTMSLERSELFGESGMTNPRSASRPYRRQ